MEISIKNMVCDRCIKSVTDIFKSEGILPIDVKLGTVTTPAAVPADKLRKIQALLEAEGFTIVEDQRVKLIQQIKTIIIELVHYGELDEMNENLSDYLSRKLKRDYTYISNIFSAEENITIEHYFILQKIEKVKEWLAYNELTLGEIAFKLGYSSVAHLSGQFKKSTGMTPTQFKQQKHTGRQKLDRI